MRQCKYRCQCMTIDQNGIFAYNLQRFWFGKSIGHASVFFFIIRVCGWFINCPRSLKICLFYCCRLCVFFFLTLHTMTHFLCAFYFLSNIDVMFQECTNNEGAKNKMPKVIDAWSRRQHQNHERNNGMCQDIKKEIIVFSLSQWWSYCISYALPSMRSIEYSILEHFAINDVGNNFFFVFLVFCWSHYSCIYLQFWSRASLNGYSFVVAYN